MTSKREPLTNSSALSVRCMGERREGSLRHEGKAVSPLRARARRFDVQERCKLAIKQRGMIPLEMDVCSFEFGPQLMHNYVPPRLVSTKLLEILNLQDGLYEREKKLIVAVRHHGFLEGYGRPRHPLRRFVRDFLRTIAPARILLVKIGNHL